MRTIFISATAPDSGQTLLAWMLARELIARGLKVGLFRPMGVRGPDGMDPAMKLLFDALGDRVAGEPDCPVMVDPEGGVDPDLAELYFKRIEKAFQAVSGRCEVCLALGSRDVFYDAEQTSLPDTRFIQMLDARVVLIDRFQTRAMTVYSTLALSSFLRGRLAGIVINHVAFADWEEFSGKVVPFLRSKGAPVLAVLSRDPVLGSPTLMDLSEILSAQVLAGGEGLDMQVTGKTISAHDLPITMNIYKRVVNKILLTGGPTEKIAAGRLTDPCGVILTGGRKPADKVLAAAASEGMPVLLTELDTFAAIDRIESTKIHLKPRDEFKVDRFRQILAGQFSMDEFIAACGV